MSVGAVEDQLGVLVGGQLALHAEAVRRRQQMGSRDNAVLRAGIRVIGVEDHYAALGIGEVAREVVNVNQFEGIEGLILLRVAEHLREVESASSHIGCQRSGKHECESRR